MQLSVRAKYRRDHIKMKGEKDQKWLDEHRHHVGFQVRCFNNQMARYLDYSFKSVLQREGCSDLTVTHSWIIHFIRQQGETPVYQRDIEHKFDISRATATTMLQLMEKNGYILRKPVPQDARLKQLVLTPKALKVEKAKDMDIIFMEQHLQEGISKEDMETFFACMEKMRENMQKQMSQSQENEEKHSCVCGAAEKRL